MRVFYDGNIYSLQTAGGVNRYFANLIQRLPVNFTPTLLVEQIRQVNYPAHPRLKIRRLGRRPGLENISYRLAQHVSKAERYFYENLADFGRYDLAHPTYYSLLTRQEVGKYRCPVVVTVWDMIHEVFSDLIDPDGRWSDEKRRAVMAADAVICISENTRNDLLARFPLPEDRVVVTHLASEIDESLSHGPEKTPSRPYYLYVGSRYRYKNFDALLAVFARVVSVRPEVRLCVVGGPFDEVESKLIAELNLADYVLNYGPVSDPHLAKLYRQSIALVYPSLYEGFGIPPLEAMACGTAVIASDCSSIPEVVGDAGLLFDPRGADELADVLIHFPDDTARRECLIKKGRARARAFSWDKTAARTLEVYRSVSA